MSNTALQQQISDEPKAVQDDVLAINTHARNLSLQIALLVPLASLLGLANSFRMLRLPDITPVADIDGVASVKRIALPPAEHLRWLAGAHLGDLSGVVPL